MSDITISATAAEKKKPAQIKVTLVDVDYTVTPPKAGMAMALARFRTSTDEKTAGLLMDRFFDWIRYAFGDQAEDVFARLEDPEDPLDIDHLNQLQRALVEYEASPNPTTSSSGSRTSRRAPGRTSKASQ